MKAVITNTGAQSFHRSSKAKMNCGDTPLEFKILEQES